LTQKAGRRLRQSWIVNPFQKPVYSEKRNPILPGSVLTINFYGGDPNIELANNSP
jgi:hypothetical protein